MEQFRRRRSYSRERRQGPGLLRVIWDLPSFVRFDLEWRGTTGQDDISDTHR